jgi:hypothetical protein
LDLDNQWSYLKTHGDAGWQQFPSYLGKFTPRILSELEKRGLRITFFVVGQDAAIDSNADALRSIADAGHEIGNHSFSHEPWMHLYPKARIQEEIVKAADCIEGVTGQRTIGFRGPGFSFSEEIMNVLAEQGFLYDASTLPTFIGPLARLYYFKTAKLSKEEASVRQDLFGSFSNGFARLRAHRQKNRDMIEIPVTTMPVLRTPIHVSYLIYLSCYSVGLAVAYFKTALRLCKMKGIAPSLLLHPPDFFGSDDSTGLAFFPGMNLDHQKKLDLVGRFLDIYCENFSVLPMREHARQVAAEAGMLVGNPKAACGSAVQR